ncbi:hypothetical protein ADK59_20555 [Streptomyces sp. XY332]|nr:hypothetical protein ADK59_20555 [Streptomyces sp. XY332]
MVSATAPDAGGNFENGRVIDRRRIVVCGSSDLGGTGGVQWRVQPVVLSRLHGDTPRESDVTPIMTGQMMFS